MSSCQGFDTPQASFIPDKEGDYTLVLTVTDANGRTASDEVTISALWDAGFSDFRVDRIVYAPNPFFGSVTVQYEGVGTPDLIHLSVFDLTGTRLWEQSATNTTSLTWNGRTQAGELAPNGPYVAVLVITGNGQVYKDRRILFVYR